jgi:copper chaperone
MATDSEGEANMEERIKIEGMSCQHCVAAVLSALESMGGLREIDVDLEKGEAGFIRGEEVTLAQVEDAVRAAGYEVK